MFDKRLSALLFYCIRKYRIFEVCKDYKIKGLIELSIGVWQSDFVIINAEKGFTNSLSIRDAQNISY